MASLPIILELVARLRQQLIALFNAYRIATAAAAAAERAVFFQLVRRRRQRVQFSSFSHLFTHNVARNVSTHRVHNERFTFCFQTRCNYTCRAFAGISISFVRVRETNVASTDANEKPDGRLEYAKIIIKTWKYRARYDYLIRLQQHKRPSAKKHQIATEKIRLHEFTHRQLIAIQLVVFRYSFFDRTRSLTLIRDYVRYSTKGKIYRNIFASKFIRTRATRQREKYQIRTVFFFFKNLNRNKNGREEPTGGKIDATTYSADLHELVSGKGGGIFDVSTRRF